MARKTIKIQEKKVDMKTGRKTNWITIPGDKLKELGWNTGDELEAEVIGNCLIFSAIDPKKKPKK